MDAIILNIFELNYLQLIQYEMLEKLVTCILNITFLQISGAKPALGGTPGMIGYGMAKAAVHQLVKSLAEPKSGLPEGAFCAGISTTT